LLQTDQRNKPWNLCKNSFNKISFEEVKVIFEEVYNQIKKETIFSNIPFKNFPDYILFEYWFDKGKHFELGKKERLYYKIKDKIPYIIKKNLRNLYSTKQKKESKTHWPIEDRYILFLHTLMKKVEKKTGLNLLPLNLWPQRYTNAFVITHDVEGPEGFQNIPILVEIEKKYGFKSMFNFVPHRYRINKDLVDYLRGEGFDVGLHGLKHDGKLFWSEENFKQRAKEINENIENLEIKGFRAPLTHRNPVWLQSLKISYDMSFFDTDPFEPIPGGTMSIYPFFMGNFIEIPYTLPQDNLLFNVLKEKNINIWKKKVDFIKRWNGMILINVHPDYINKKNSWEANKYPLTLYEEFLSFMKDKRCWNTLPKEIANWWSKKTKKKNTRL